MPSHYLNRTSCTEILNSIAAEYKEDIKSKIRASKMFSLMADESVDQSSKKQLIIFVKFVDEQSIPVVKYWETCELKDFTAKGIYAKVCESLGDILQYLVCLCTDGAPVMRSRDEGLLGHLLKNRPYLLDIHCMAHRFALGLNKATDENSKITEVLNFVSDLYSFFSRSPKRILKLLEKQNEIEEYTQHLIQPCKIRWMSFLRAAKRIKDCIMSIHATLKELKGDDPHAFGLKRKLQRQDTLLWLHILAELTPLLNPVLNSLEKQIVDLVFIETACRTSISIMQSNFLGERITSPSYISLREKLTNLGSAELPTRYEGKFKVRAAKRFSITTFEIAVVELVGKLVTNLQQLSTNLGIIQNFRVFDLTRIRQSPLPEFFGMVEIKTIFEYYEDIRATKNIPDPFINDYLLFEWSYFLAFVRNINSKISNNEIANMILTQDISAPNCQKLFQLYLSLPLSSVDCERGFSKMNLIKNKLRSQLSEDNLDSLLHISLNAPSNFDEDVDRCIDRWINSKNRYFV
jgi:hypothetical protein